MGFRIMQLQYETMKEKSIVKEGIILSYPCYEKDFGFVKVQTLFTPPEQAIKIRTVSEYEVRDKGDGFKTIIVNPCNTLTMEEGILLIIPHATSINSNSKKIAGRYPEEGIFLLKPNDKIELTRGKLTEKFAALQFEGKMYLIKLH